MTKAGRMIIRHKRRSAMNCHTVFIGRDLALGQWQRGQFRAWRRESSMRHTQVVAAWGQQRDASGKQRYCGSDSRERAPKTAQAGLILQGWLARTIFLQFLAFLRLQSVSYTI